MSEKLLPCPFCGSAFKMGREPNDNHPVAGQFYLYHDYGPLGSLARLCPISINQHFYTEAEAACAWNTRAAIQADAEPVAWKYEYGDGSRFFSSIRQNQPFHDMEPRRRNGWTETPLYAHPPVADRAAPETSGKLRDAVEVWRYASDAATLGSVKYKPAADEAAAAIIEQDREAVRAEQAAELSKIKALAETLAGALDSVVWSDYYGIKDDMMSNGCEHGFKPASSCPNKGCDKGKLERTINEALRKYKETRDAS